MVDNIRKILTVLVFASLLLISSSMTDISSAVEMSSSQYRITGFTASSGSGSSTGGNYELDLTIGFPTTGTSTGGNYKLFLGPDYYDGDINHAYCEPMWTWMGSAKEGYDTIDGNIADDLCCGDDLGEQYIAPSESVDGKEACVTGNPDCVLFGYSFDTETNTDNMIDDGNQSCYSTNLFRGFCDSDGWNRSTDKSPDICCCLGSGYWSNSNQCCDEDDTWLNDDMTWACLQGTSVGSYSGLDCDSSMNALDQQETLAYECDKITVSDTEYWWNGTHWTDRSPGHCGCSSDADCQVGYECLRNTCLKPTSPEIMPIPTITIYTGDTKEISIETVNRMNITDNVELSIDGEMDNWIWFKGQERLDQHRKEISIPKGSGIKTAIKIMGGQTGTYLVTIKTDSLHTGKKSDSDLLVNVIPKTKEDVKETETPGLSGLAFMLCFILPALYVLRQEND